MKVRKRLAIIAGAMAIVLLPTSASFAHRITGHLGITFGGGHYSGGVYIRPPYYDHGYGYYDDHYHGHYHPPHHVIRVPSYHGSGHHHYRGKKKYRNRGYRKPFARHRY